MKNVFKKSIIIASFTLAALAVGVFTVKAIGPNLIANPDFETATAENTPAHWATGGFGNNDRAVTYETVAGNKVGKVVITSYTDGDAKWVFETVPVEAGSLYRFSDRYMSNTTTFLFAEYTKADASATYEQIASIPSSGGAWMTGTQDFTPPAGTVSVSVFHTLQGVGELTTDDYSLAQLNPSNENQFSQGIISITFDDGWLNQYETAAPILAAANTLAAPANNMPATFYVMSGTTTNSEFGYMTTAQLLDLQSNGNEIGGHTINHCNMTLLPDTASCAFQPAGGSTTAQQEIQGSKNALTALGAMITTFAYPNGGYTDAIKQNVTDAGISAARAIDAGFNTRFSDKLALKTQVIDTSVQMATVKGWIDTAAANKTWLILTFHQVADLATLQAHGDEGGITPEDFQEIVTYIKNLRDGSVNPVQVMTVADVLPLMATSTVDPVDPLDTLAPVIQLNGSATVNVITGTTYTDAGATASDNVDGNLTSSIVVGGSVDTATAGTYTLTYNVSDAAGNAATEVTRTVVVSSNSIPVITLNGNAVITLAYGATYTEEGATALDSEDGDLTSSIVIAGSVNTSAAGSYPITYNVEDTTGGAALTVTRTVVVQAQVINNGGGGGGGGGGGSGYIAPVVPVTPVTPTTPTTPGNPTTPGTVLGSTCNTILINNVSFRNAKNKVEDVKKLQTFLNTHMNAKLPVTGFYGNMTLAAVKNFQMKYKAEILTPVKLKAGNGNVFTLTRAKINALNCVAN